jgi:hypothetical protein
MTTKNKEAEMEDALLHIVRMCNKARGQTLRIRWIALRAECALNGTDDWKTAKLPTNVPNEFLRWKAEVKEGKSDEG